MTRCNVLIVGSGPVGATFARLLSEQTSTARIVMVDAGPQLTRQPGTNLMNLEDAEERTQAQIRSQGPTQFLYPELSFLERVQALDGQRARLARPATHLASLDEAELRMSGLPAAAMSTNVGGMGAHWTCVCPRPGNAERSGFIPDVELDQALDRAEHLLRVKTDVFLPSLEGDAIHQVLSRLFDPLLPASRAVCRMPLACSIEPNGRRVWSGADTILGSLAESRCGDRFLLRSETVCRWLVTRGDRVVGAVVEHLPSGSRDKIDLDVAIVAADALRTPQLLWASGIRPPALGHYLNEHLWTFSAVALHQQFVRSTAPAQYRSPSHVMGVFQVPYHSPTHPFQGQVMHLDLSPLLAVEGDAYEGKHVVALGWSCEKEPRYEDCVYFSENAFDYLGMPRMQFAYGLTDADRTRLRQASREQLRASTALGTPMIREEPLQAPPGASLHYQGTVRMGRVDDGQSVCDTHSRVWGFSNLFVGGNGVIPTATVCNPTLTSVAMAVRACDQLAEQCR